MSSQHSIGEIIDDVGEEQSDETDLATIDEEMETIVQMTKLAEQTVKPGVMRLPVDSVTTAKNSPQAVITVKHPVEGDIRMYYKKMDDQKTWTDETELKRVLDWYGYTRREMHALDSDRLYVQYAPNSEEGGASDWHIVPPPSKTKQKAQRIASAFYEDQVPQRVRSGLALAWVASRPVRRKTNLVRVNNPAWLGLAGGVAAVATTVFFASMMVAGFAAGAMLVGMLFVAPFVETPGDEVRRL